MTHGATKRQRERERESDCVNYKFFCWKKAHSSGPEKVTHGVNRSDAMVDPEYSSLVELVTTPPNSMRKNRKTFLRTLKTPDSHMKK